MLSEVSQNSGSFSQSFSLGETQFIPQENDELWAVERILAENGKRYLIKWAGVDGNGKEWENSWVPKHDVTNDLIQEWKALKRKESEAKKGRTRRALIHSWDNCTSYTAQYNESVLPRQEQVCFSSISTIQH